MKCLVVDDSATMRPIITRAVAQLGFGQVAEAATAASALAVIGSDTDLVIADWGVSDMPAPEFVRRIRENTREEIAILVVTTEARLGELTDEVSAAIDGYLLKPFCPDAFGAAIERVLALKAA